MIRTGSHQLATSTVLRLVLLRAFAPLREIRLALAGLVVALAGCSGGSLDLISLNFRDIDPPDARPTALQFDRGYWWTADDGRLLIALVGRREELLPLFGPREASVLLDLERLPAGRARNYALTPRELRSVLRHGPLMGRLSSQSGIAAVYREGDDRLRVSLRAQVGLQLAQFLGGWSQPSRFLLFGKVIALREAEGGDQIARDIAAAWQDPAATQPAAATRPAGD